MVQRRILKLIILVPNDENRLPNALRRMQDETQRENEKGIGIRREGEIEGKDRDRIERNENGRIKVIHVSKT